MKYQVTAHVLHHDDDLHGHEKGTEKQMKLLQMRVKLEQDEVEKKRQLAKVEVLH